MTWKLSAVMFLLLQFFNCCNGQDLYKNSIIGKWRGESQNTIIFLEISNDSDFVMVTVDKSNKKQKIDSLKYTLTRNIITCKEKGAKESMFHKIIKLTNKSLKLEGPSDKERFDEAIPIIHDMKFLKVK